MRRKTQVIGDRKVINPRTSIHHLRNAQGAITETLRLSMETCGCGYSMARAGVGYRATNGWICKRCGQIHTLDRGMKLSPNDPDIRPDPKLMREFDRRTAHRVAGSITPEDLECEPDNSR